MSDNTIDAPKSAAEVAGGGGIPRTRWYSGRHSVTAIRIRAD
jgi:hypothetical protein